ncbi:hypothetical protein FRD00_15995 [Persicimonas caeni]|nr:hypothetical protein [Persicimonas caeni]QED33410.1 hypothetical protein FRD00_15995 [Persicimonas caeni]
MSTAPRYSEQWHALRARGVGSSDVPAILGLSAHASAEDIWRTKLGEEPRRQPWLDDYADFGRWFTPHLRRWCEAEDDIDLVPGAELGILQSTRWSRAITNIGAYDPAADVIEAYKTTSQAWKSVPTAHYVQCQHQLFVTGARRVRLRQFICPVDRALLPGLRDRLGSSMPQADPAEVDAALVDWLLDAGEIHTWIFERDDALIERMLMRERRFWAFVDMQVTPIEADPAGTVDLTEAPQVHAACVEYARLQSRYDAKVREFLDAEGLEVPTQASVGGTADKALKAARRELRRAIDQAVALLDERPKRVVIGEHHATWIDRGTHAFWNPYLSGDSGVVDF